MPFEELFSLVYLLVWNWNKRLTWFKISSYEFWKVSMITWSLSDGQCHSTFRDCLSIFFFERSFDSIRINWNDYSISSVKETGRTTSVEWSKQQMLYKLNADQWSVLFPAKCTFVDYKICVVCVFVRLQFFVVVALHYTITGFGCQRCTSRIASRHRAKDVLWMYISSTKLVHALRAVHLIGKIT